jgi:hypothetical protein
MVDACAAILDNRGRRKEDAPDLAILALQLLLRLRWWVPTERGLAWIEQSDRVMQDIEMRLAASIGGVDFLHTRTQIAALVAALEPQPDGAISP